MAAGIPLPEPKVLPASLRDNGPNTYHYIILFDELPLPAGPAHIKR
jgi:hypothetical protein